MFAASKSGSVVVKDSQFNYVTMLLHGDGTNGAQNNTFLDSSSNNFTITRNGNTTQGSFSPYGSNWSNYFDGTSGQYLNAPASTSFSLGTGDFTVEGWVYPTTTSGTRPIVEIRTLAANSTGFAFLSQSGATTLNVYTNGGFAGASTNSLTTNRWNHVALVRSGNTWTYWINGVSSGSFTNSSTQIDGAVTGPKIGGSTTAGEVWIGYMSNIRVVKGTAVYTTAFTPSTTPLTAISGTSLLTCQSNRFIDTSSNAFAITVNGTPSVQRFNPFGTSTAYSTSVIGGSGYFDGSGDYLSIADNTAFNLSGGDYTLEAWIYWNGDTANYRTIIAKRILASSTTAWEIFLTITTGNICFFDGTIRNSSVKPVPNSWNHIAACWNNSTSQINMYLNGTRILQTSATNTNQSASVYIGSFPSYSEDFGGNISDVRVVKGSQVYTGTTYTVPTAPLTAISGTSLLCNMTNGAIYDNAMMNDLETVGNVQISTSVKKYGTGSMYFDGTGDYLYQPIISPNFSFQESFTIEFWVNFSSVPANYIALFGGTGANTQFFITTKSNGNGLRFGLTGVAEYAAGTKTWSTGTWYHIALVRNGTNVKFYVDGTNISDSTYTNSTTYTGALLIGGGLGVSDLNGYLDDVRITKGYARYTSNFTPPTAAFSNIGPN